ncbi:MAG TPA: peptidylprolyl isomerase [Homoserinimonas sp.]|nr:peptidylprolyl isomerase [Homoserinimonas sp.]
MAPSKTAERDARAARDRLRRYNARQAVFAHTVRRRIRDNVIWITIAVLVITLAAVTQVLYFTAGPGVPPPAPAETTEPVEEGANAEAVPSPSLAEARTWTGELTLNDVPLGIELDGAAAPQAVSAFVGDVQTGYFPGKTCHRLTDNGFFVLQCGSIDGAGGGDPEYTYGPVENAPADNVYPAGTIAMARAGGDAFSNGHQFFIVYEETTIQADAAGGYTVIGQVTSGLDQLIERIASHGVADGAHDGAPVVPTTITGVRIE